MLVHRSCHGDHNTYPAICWFIVPVHGSHSDNLSSHFHVLSHRTLVAAIFVQTHKLRNLVIFVYQFNRETCVVADGIPSTILK